MPKDQTPAAVTSQAPIPAPGRIVHLYGDKWDGPRPGIIVANNLEATGDDEPIAFVDVNIFLHGKNDQPLLTTARLSPSGNTIIAVPLFGGGPDSTKLTDECDGWGQVYAIFPPRI
jgi:hypothetical protein